MSEEANRHILSDFETSLDALRKNVLMMSSLTTRNFDSARRGLFERDEDWCNTAIADDEEIDALEIQIDSEGIEIMLRFHPFASDLRNVISAMRMSANLERVADQTVGIARRARKLLGMPVMPETVHLDPMFRHASSMLADAIRAYAESDPELARTLKPRDRELDAMNRDFANMVTDCMTRDPDQIRAYLELIFIARFLERIGDQATSIAEDTVFAIAAQDIRHTATRA